jgi:hypothetical protein
MQKSICLLALALVCLCALQVSVCHASRGMTFHAGGRGGHYDAGVEDVPVERQARTDDLTMQQLQDLVQQQGAAIQVKRHDFFASGTVTSNLSRP